MLALSAGNGTNDPLLVSILTARQINTALGGPFVSPFEVGQIPDEFVDACMLMNTKLPQFQEARRKMEQRKTEFRNRSLRKH